jgi:lysophospholipase L1-like esterase
MKTIAYFLLLLLFNALAANRVKGYVPRIILIMCFLVQGTCLFGQELTWHTPIFVEGVAVRDTAHIYHRLPQEWQNKVRPIVWNLSLNTAGEFIHFRSTARSFTIKYKVSGKTMAMAHMPSTGTSGLDLYAMDKNGEWNWAPPGFRFGDTCVYTYKNIMVASGASADFYLYLPLYNTVEWLSIGTEKDKHLDFVPERKEKPVVAYGTSILQGAVTSRPGLAWSNILERNLDRKVINLGFSGNGKFEKPIFDLMGNVDAALYIFDCMPNLTREANTKPSEVENNIRYGITKLRTAHPEAPILFTEYPDGDVPFYADTTLMNERHTANIFIAGVYKKLLSEGVKNLYLLSAKEIGFDINSLTEATHPNDIGMMKYALAYEKKIREILHQPVGNLTTQRPVQQYRDGFDWGKRHEAIVENTTRTNPRAIIFGNSIINYWGGEPKPEKGGGNGEAAWQRYLLPEQVQNAGFGNDRIENVLWRIYHGELDQFKGRKIIITIGTNNLSVNTDEEIVRGLEFLVQQVRQRKPNAAILLGAILPRKNKLERVSALNQKIRKMAAVNHCRFFDLSPKFMKGRELNDELFMDGLHPNEAGYELLGRDLKDLIH